MCVDWGIRDKLRYYTPIIIYIKDISANGSVDHFFDTVYIITLPFDTCYTIFGPDTGPINSYNTHRYLSFHSSRHLVKRVRKCIK